MGGYKGHLQLLDMSSCNITHEKMYDIDIFYDMLAIDDSQFLLATENGMLKTTKDMLLKHYHKGSGVGSLSPTSY